MLWRVLLGGRLAHLLPALNPEANNLDRQAVNPRQARDVIDDGRRGARRYDALRAIVLVAKMELQLFAGRNVARESYVHEIIRKRTIAFGGPSCNQACHLLTIEV